MKFKEFGNREAPAVVLLHGGGLSWWAWKKVIERLEQQYRLITPVIDGCGEAAEAPFVSIEESAKNLIAYIDENCSGRVFALCGLSIGAQIAAEALSVRADLTDCAVLESALCCPLPGTKMLTVPACRMSYGLIRKRWFSKLQANALCLPEELFEEYFTDSMKMSLQSLINTVCSNGTYKLKEGIRRTEARVLIIVGGKETTAIQTSARMLQEAISGSKLYVASGMKHGELSLRHPKQYTELLKSVFLQNGAIATSGFTDEKG